VGRRRLARYAETRLVCRKANGGARYEEAEELLALGSGARAGGVSGQDRDKIAVE
jgi:hypothetical protein